MRCSNFPIELFRRAFIPQQNKVRQHLVRARKDEQSGQKIGYVLKHTQSSRSRKLTAITIACTQKKSDHVANVRSTRKMQEHTDGVLQRVPKAIRLRLPVEQTKNSKKNIVLPLSNRCRETDDRESELEVPLSNLLLLSRLLTVARKPHQPGGAPPQSCIASNQSRTRSQRRPTDPAGSIIKRH